MNEPADIRKRRAFSLIELLVVIAIIVVLSVLAVPAFNAIKGAGGLTKAANDVSGILEQARAYAMAQNTHVWVGFRQDEDTLVVAVVASQTGVSSPSTNISRLGKIARFENTRLVDLSSSDSQRPEADKQLADANDSSLQFTLESPAELSFGPQVVQWNSQGEARISSSNIDRLIEIGLQASVNGAVRNAANYAAVQVGGLSGAVSVYRP